MISPPSLILRELRHHRFNAGLALFALTTAVALLVVVRLLTTAAERETRRVVRDLGFNLRIIPRDTDPDQFFLTGYSSETLPADAVQRLAAGSGTFLSFNHLTPSLERRIQLAGRDALLTGLGRAVVGPGEAKQPMGFNIPDGKAFLGQILAQRLQVKPGSTLDVQGRSLTVEKVLVEAGTDDDIRLFTSLGDAQAILGLPGRISEIKAIDCLCLTADQDPLSILREELGRLLPEARVIQMRTMADARARQRQAAARIAAFAVPLTLLVTAAWVCTLAVLNVRTRRQELGLWRALGTSSSRIASLFLGKAALLGLLAGVFGYLLGTAVSLLFGPRLFPVTAAGIQPEHALLPWALLLTPAFAALASFLPAMIAVAQDPAETLRAD
jgi:putative ABC transport system permease protein